MHLIFWFLFQNYYQLSQTVSAATSCTEPPVEPSTMMSWCLMSSDAMRHIRDKLWPMPKHGSTNLYVHGNQKARQDGQPSPGPDVHLDSHTAPELWAEYGVTEPVWLIGEGPRIESASALLSQSWKVVVCGHCLVSDWLSLSLAIYETLKWLYRRLPIRNAWLVVIPVSGDHRCSQW